MAGANVLRFPVVAEIVLLLASVLTRFLSCQTSPAIDYFLAGPAAGPLARIAEADATMVTYMLGVLLVVFVVMYVASLDGLLLPKSWSRRLYVLTFLVGVCVYPFMGSSIVDPFTGTFEYLGGACSGAILAALFSSDAKAIFEVRPPDASRVRSRER